jgi:hypothetical protein
MACFVLRLRRARYFTCLHLREFLLSGFATLTKVALADSDGKLLRGGPCIAPLTSQEWKSNHQKHEYKIKGKWAIIRTLVQGALVPVNAR